jgi:predicted nucleotidyltransferase component of viral defense system
MIETWLSEYKIHGKEDLINAKREIMQEVALAGLSRGGFFDHATFYGGTALRIFCGLNRYSEDLDFSLNYIDENFDFEHYFEAIKNEFILLGLDVEITLKQKKSMSAIESAFLKENTIWGMIHLDEKSRKATNFPNLKIKIEVDKTPPLKFIKEQKLLVKPYSFYVSCMSIESLFVGKMHAVLFREWKNRTKGRDWYDLEWYVKRGASLRLEELTDRGKNSNHIVTDENTITKQEFCRIMHNRIDNLDVEMAKFDIREFVTNPSDLNIWSKQYFHDLVDHIKTI